mgnify:CR=1 FL=1
MKIIALRTEGLPDTRRLLDQMCTLRAKIFAERLGWDVNTHDDRERDRFDDLNPTYVLAVTRHSEVVGSVRLLPAMGPTMLSSIFPELLVDAQYTPHAHMVESSRFCVDTTVEGSKDRGLHQVTRFMFAGILEWCLSTGHTELVTVTDVAVERILARAGWPLRRLGLPQTIGQTAALAGQLAVNFEAFARVKPPEYLSDFRTYSGCTPAAPL